MQDDRLVRAEHGSGRNPEKQGITNLTGRAGDRNSQGGICIHLMLKHDDYVPAPEFCKRRESARWSFRAQAGDAGSLNLSTLLALAYAKLICPAAFSG
jgi:hypothetical protein